MIKETNTAKEKLEQKLQRREEGSHLDAWGRDLGRVNSKVSYMVEAEQVKGDSER